MLVFLHTTPLPDNRDAEQSGMVAYLFPSVVREAEHPGRHRLL
jgi:hypothetical protein